jgi:hypothetical protein
MQVYWKLTTTAIQMTVIALTKKNTTGIAMRLEH